MQCLQKTLEGQIAELVASFSGSVIFPYDELSGLFGGFGRYAAGAGAAAAEMATYLSMFQSARIMSGTKGGGGEVRLMPMLIPRLCHIDALTLNMP